jgi:uncharacterized protein YceK
MDRRAIPAIVLVPFLVVAIVVSSSACGTIVNFATNDPPKPYGGVMCDVNLAVTEFDPVERPGQLLVAPLFILDLGLSAALDTATLPIVFLKTIEAACKHVAEHHRKGGGPVGPGAPD